MEKESNQKVLILKTGYSEILDKRTNSRIVSLGDVLRTTPLLHPYKNQNVTWITDKKAIPLLKDNPLIHNLFALDFITSLQLQSEEFDTVINLEKIAGICALADKIRARKSRYGFTFNSQTGEAEAYAHSFNLLNISINSKLKKQNQKTAQEILFEIIGEEWKGEEYILGYKPKTKEIYQVGLNTKIGEKWPTKAWPNKNWDKLEEMLKANNIKVTRQDKQPKEILTDLYRYTDWINSCRIIVSNDSLGMHLGIVLKKEVLGLFGSTNSKEVFFYNRGKAILSEPIPNCLPCFETYCKKGRNCMEDIQPERLYEEIKNIMSK